METQIYDGYVSTFVEDFSFSQANASADIAAIRAVFGENTTISKAEKWQDIAGVDYLLSDRGETVQVKRRRRGVSKYFRNGPDICVEFGHIDEHGERRPGWAVDADKAATWLFYLFDPADSVSFVFEMGPFVWECVNKLPRWTEKYSIKSIEQVNSQGVRYRTNAVFVPVFEFESPEKIRA